MLEAIITRAARRTETRLLDRKDGARPTPGSRIGTDDAFTKGAPNFEYDKNDATLVYSMNGRHHF